MRQVVVYIKSDFDHSLLADETLEFTWRGKVYEIDVTSGQAAELEAVVQEWINVGRPKKRGKRTAKAATPVNCEPAAEKTGTAQRKRIREWGRENGFTVARTGYIKADVLAGYAAAHPGEKVPEK